MSDINLKETLTPTTPTATRHRVYIGTDGHLKKVDSTGAVFDYNSAASYTDADAQNAVGGILDDTTSIDLTYNSTLHTIKADLTATGVLAGPYGASNQVTQFTVDAQGRLTAASASTITTSTINAQPHDTTLDALAAFNTNGILTQTAPDTFQGRVLQAGAGIALTNADGVSGNPTIASTITQYTDELAQDAVAAALTDSPTVAFSYNDSLNQISANVVDASISSAKLDDVIGATTVGSNNQIPQLQINAKGRVTSATVVSVTPATIGAQPQDATLDALAAFNTNGFVTQTGVDTFQGRTLQSGAGISIANANGIGGDPVISSTITQYTNQNAQDAVGGILVDSGTVNLEYNSTLHTIKANLDDTAVTAGSYGGAFSIPQFTVDAQGRLTNASTNAALTPASLGAASTNHDATHIAGGSDEITGNLNAVARVNTLVSGSSIAARRAINFIPSGLNITAVDNPSQERVDVTMTVAADTGITQLTGEVLAGPGNGSQAATLSNDAVIAKVLTGLSSLWGQVVSADSILQALGKLQNSAALQPQTIDGNLIIPAGWNCIRGVTKVSGTNKISIGAGAILKLI